MIGKNNPFNIRYSCMNNWKGQTGQTRGFCDFSELKYGVRAAYILFFRTYKKRGLCTVSELLNAFAPPTENNTSYYIDYICDNLHIFPFDFPSDKARFLKFVSIYEGNPVDLYTIDRVIDEFNFDV